MWGVLYWSPGWIKKIKATKNTYDKCFQYKVTVALNYEEIKWNPERTLNIKPFINKYNWKGINYPSKIDYWKTFGRMIQQLLLIFYIVKKKKHVQIIFQKLIRLVKNK